ncbi:MAG: hypothetical protein ACLFS3_01065 [Candidatus Aenigmatarchaeota archaeon]
MDLSFLALELSTYQLYGLFFLLGSLLVSSASDLKRMVAQSEFFEIWTIFTATMFVLDFYPGIFSLDFSGGSFLKWGLILGVCVFSWSKTGIIFSVARMDVAAMAAVMSLLNPYSLVLFVVLLKVIDLVERPLLRSGDRYPFLPVVLTTVLIVLSTNLYFI